MVTYGLSGIVNGQLLYKTYRYRGTVVSKIPDRSKVVLSDKQKSYNSKFRSAVAYAKGVINDPVKKAEYQLSLEEGRTVYHTALAEFLRGQAGEV